MLAVGLIIILLLVGVGVVFYVGWLAPQADWGQLALTQIPEENLYTLNLHPTGSILEGLPYNHPAVSSANVYIYKQDVDTGDWVCLGNDTTDSSGIFDFTGITIKSGTPVLLKISASGFYETWYEAEIPYALSNEQTDGDLGVFYVSDVVGAVATNFFMKMFDMTNGMTLVDNETSGLAGVYDQGDNGTIIDILVQVQVTEDDSSWGAKYGTLVDFEDNNEERKCLFVITATGGDYELLDLSFSEAVTTISFSDKTVYLLEIDYVDRMLDSDSNPLSGHNGLYSFSITMDTGDITDWTSMTLTIDAYDNNAISYFQEHSAPNTGDDVINVIDDIGYTTMQA